jgi:hypothetical protein
MKSSNTVPQYVCSKKSLLYTWHKTLPSCSIFWSVQNFVFGKTKKNNTLGGGDAIPEM